ncbi:MAG: hypothetical protein OQK32_04160, partial [Gammaproteobacteria bacterium]|nr:hypothetical protein [Gammaproteobacteria bacterium]
VDSSLVFYPSILLIAAAVLVFWLRYRNSVDPVEYIKADNPLNDDGLEEIMNETSNLPEHERRFGDEREFPLVDDNDVIIPFDRRTKKKPD